MPNNFTASGLEQLASAFVAMLADGGTLINTIWRDTPSAAFQVGKGDTVTIREPLIVPAANFTGTATATDVVEGKYTATIDQNPYSQTVVTQVEQTLVIEQLATQVIQPQAAGISEYIDESIAAVLATTTGAADSPAGGTWADAVKAAREVLSTNKVPAGDRWLAISPDITTALLSETVVTVGNLPGAGTALAEGYVGRYMGFNIVESPLLAPQTAYGYHRSAVAGVFRLPVAPQGAATGSATWNGISSQVVYAYDPTKLADVLTVQSLYGLGKSDTSFDARAVKLALVP